VDVPNTQQRMTRMSLADSVVVTVADNRSKHPGLGLDTDALVWVSRCAHSAKLFAFCIELSGPEIRGVVELDN
jgi:hypothetical protein